MALNWAGAAAPGCAVACSAHETRWAPSGLTLRREILTIAALAAASVFGAAGLARAPAAAAAARLSPRALSAELSRDMAHAGRGSGALVYDASARRTLFASRATRARPPASVQKLYTSTTALLLMGGGAQLSTSVLAVGSQGPDGAWNGDLYLRGGGDPTFGSTDFIRSFYGAGQGSSVSDLALMLSQRGITAVHGRVLGDESLFDGLRGGPRTGGRADRDVEGTLSALAFNRGQVGRQRGPHAPAAYAAEMLSAALRGVGIPVDGSPGSAPTPAPASATPLAAVASPPLQTLLRLQNRPSDNYLAETLIKGLGARFGGAGTTAAGAGVVRRTLGRLGLPVRVVDGSGLSRADRTSPRAVVTLLAELSGDARGQVLRSSLAVAGRAGTLKTRMRGTAAAGRCQAKTGTLDLVSNLAGWCSAAGGHTIVFALEMDGISLYSAHVLQDRMAVALARYDDASGPAQPPPRALPGGFGSGR